MASVRLNVFANLFGQGWRTAMGIVFVPFYIEILGIEAYGLIAIFALLQAWLAILDMGMTPTLSREMARFLGGAHDAQSIRDVLRTMEVVASIIAVAIGLAIWGASDWLSTHWLQTQDIDPHVAARAFVAMGVVAALRFVEDIYTSSMAGLGKQVTLNLVVIVAATCRNLGAILVLKFVSPTLEAFFIWQGAVSLLTVLGLASTVYRALPTPPQRPRFSNTAIADVWRFAAGMMTLTVLSLVLTQVDKLMLSKILTLEEFAYYALATTAARGLYALTTPVTTAFFPRFTELATRGDVDQLKRAYHQGAQFVTVLTGAAALVLGLFSDTVMLAWTDSSDLSNSAAGILSLLAIGNLLNALMYVPYHLQLAYGWTKLAIYTNVVAVTLLVPALAFVVPRYGAIGAGAIWVCLNAVYLTFNINVMHRHLLKSEMWRWYGTDVLLPLAVGTLTAVCLRLVLPRDSSRMWNVALLVGVSALVLAATALSAPATRERIRALLRLSTKPAT